MEEFVELTRENTSSALEIYNFYVMNTTATYGTVPLSLEEFISYYQIENPKSFSYLVIDNGNVVGFCLLKPWNAKKEAYDHTYEATMYFAKDFCGKGYGKRAFEFLEKKALETDIFVIMAGVCGENGASNGLCEKMGYEKCGHLKKVGFKFGRFLDILYFEKILKKDI